MWMWIGERIELYEYPYPTLTGRIVIWVPEVPMTLVRLSSSGPGPGQVRVR